MSNFNENGFSVKEQVLAIVAGLLIVAIIGWFLPVGSGSLLNSGATGTQYIEDYDPLVMQAGLNTNKAASFGSTVSITGATTLTGLLTTGSGGIQIGSSNGTVVTQFIATTCTPSQGADATVAATSTAYVSCTGITGVTSTSNVVAQFATSTNAIGAQWALVGSKASTTAGAVDLKLMNLTGTAAIPSVTGVASSTKLHIVN